MKLNTTTLLIVLLGMLVVMSGIQAVQLAGIVYAIQNGASVSSSSTQAKAQSGSGLGIQSQVGGCG